MRLKAFLVSSMTGLALMIAPPALAQDEVPSSEAGMDAAFAKLGEMFPVDPLTTEQEARLPLATQIVAKLIPDGTMADMMGGMYDKLMDPFMDMAKQSATSRAARGLGLEIYDLTLSDSEAREIAAMFDPAWETRQEREMALFPDMMKEAMNIMEPTMRKAMSELYAINFSEAQLKDIDAFFSTETGVDYARKSYAMASDPRMIVASMEAMPALMGAIGGMEERAKAATADLPAERGFAELSDSEKARIAAITGYDVSAIEGFLGGNYDFACADDDAACAAEEAAVQNSYEVDCEAEPEVCAAAEAAVE